MNTDIDALIGDWIDKKCPKCQSQLLANTNGDEWCSHAHCDFGCEDFYEALDISKTIRLPESINTADEFVDWVKSPTEHKGVAKL